MGESVVPGRLIVTYDGRMFYESIDGLRLEITDILELPSDGSRLELLAPLDRFYWIQETEKLWKHHKGKWKCLNPDMPFFDSETNMIKNEFLTFYDQASKTFSNDYFSFYNSETNTFINQYFSFINEETGEIKLDALPSGGSDGSLPGEPGQPGAPGIPGAAGGVVILGKDGTVAEGYLPLATVIQKGIATLGSTGGAARFGEKKDVGLDKVSNDAQVKEADLGGALNTLASTIKKIIPAINELFEKKLNIDSKDYVKSPGNQGEEKVMIAPLVKGDPLTLIELSRFARTYGPGAIVGSDSTPNEILMDTPGQAGKDSAYARADHAHPIKISFEGTLNNIKPDGANASLGSTDKIPRSDHVHKQKYTLTLSGTTLTITTNN